MRNRSSRGSELCPVGGPNSVIAIPFLPQERQGLVEQKNGSIVRRLVGYGRFEGMVSAQALARLYFTPPPQPIVDDLDRFAASLRTAWRDGERRPTHRRPYRRRKPVPKRPSMLDEAQDQIRAWLDGEPTISALEVLRRLELTHPDRFNDRHLRTVHSAVKARPAGAPDHRRERRHHCPGTPDRRSLVTRPPCRCRRPPYSGCHGFLRD